MLNLRNKIYEQTSSLTEQMDGVMMAGGLGKGVKKVKG